MAGSICKSAGEYLSALGELLTRVDAGAIERYADALFEAWSDRRAVWVFGNGGSASTASHHVCDYVKTAAVEGRPRLRAHSLVDNTETLTAIGNDLGYEHTFRFVLESHAQPGDLAVAISCSGNSPNVAQACQWAKTEGLTLTALTGFAGGKAGALADIHINVPSDNYGLIEDVHLSIGHIVSQGLHRRIREAG